MTPRLHASWPENLSLQIAHRLIGIGDTPVQTGRQARHPVQDRLAKRLVTAVGLRNRFQAAVAHAFAFTTSTKIKLLKNEMRPNPETSDGSTICCDPLCEKNSESL